MIYRRRPAPQAFDDRPACYAGGRRLQIFRVLKPGGRLWAEEIYEPFIVQPVLRRLFAHPQDRFDRAGFDAGLRAAGFSLVASAAPTRFYGFHIAQRPR